MIFFNKNFNWTNKKVLVRCDFNVPINEKGEILDDFRIKETIPTIEYLIKKGAKIILISHLRKSGFQRLKSSKKPSLKPVAKRLEKLLKQGVHPVKPFAESKRKSKILFNRVNPVKSRKAGPSTQSVECSVFNRVKFLNDCLGEKIKKAVEEMKKGEVVLLENLRFYKGEEKNDKKFAKKLSKLGNIYINDAFGTCHRDHASITGLPKFLPSTPGLLLEKEIKNLSKLVRNPKKPLTVIIGGAKIETKIKLIEKFLKNCNWLLTGGALAGAILKEKRQKIINKKQDLLFNSKKICLPIDVKVSKKKNGKGSYIIKKLNEIEKDDYIFDIGSQTQKFFREKILKSQTIFWNGPLGLMEEEQFTKGTKNIAKAITLSNAYKVIGGGDLVAFLNKLKLTQKFNHISTGGGAMLAFLSGEKLPGIIALESCKL